ncbi:MAG TPA: sulfatase [Candidatus Acidoferrum sp.]|nr:sulfatase [Candidatus Acidoferrum sp.]
MDRPNVLLIVLDCVRADRLPPTTNRENTTPSIDSFSMDSTIFSNATTVAPWTLPSHGSMFTGLYSSEHGAVSLERRRIRPDVKTLAEILSDAGYETVAVCQNDSVVSIGKTTGLDRGFSTFYGTDEIIATSVHRRLCNVHGLKTLLNIYSTFLLNRHLTELSISLIKKTLKKSHEKDEKPLFMFVNLLNAHFPYEDGVPSKRSLRRLLETVRRARSHTVPAPIQRQLKQLATKNEFTEQEFAKLRQEYNECVQFMDEQLGELFNFMRNHQIIDKTLIIITADHGENIGDHGLLGHDLSVHDSLLRVPLIIRYPKKFPTNTTVSRQVEIRRIFHTIVDVVLGSGVGDYLRTDPSLLNEAQHPGDAEDYVYGEYFPSRRELSILEEYGARLGDQDIKDSTRFVRDKSFKYVESGTSLGTLYSTKNEDMPIDRVENAEQYDSLNDRLQTWKNQLHAPAGDEADKTVFDEKEDKILTERLQALGYN